MYEIDGAPYSGAAGLVALSVKPVGTATVVYGRLNVAARRFEATEVRAGSSVAWGTSDVVTGNVTARNGDSLTVRGATLVRADGTFGYHDTVTVLIGDGTKIVKQLSATMGDKADISVGSRISVFGMFQTGDVLDASNGLARLLLTTLTGTANVTGSGELEIALQTIDGRRFANFDFAGTGATPTDDADPTHYEVATSTLDLSGITSGTPVRVRGFVQQFGAAPPDFNAQSVINVSAIPAWLGVTWSPASASPFTTIGPAALTLDLNGAGDVHHVWRGGVVTDLTSLGLPPTIESAFTHGLYAIGDNGVVQVYTQFEAYTEALSEKLASGKMARALGADGSFNDANATLSAGRSFAAFD
jgi:hypothetical protein